MLPPLHPGTVVPDAAEGGADEARQRPAGEPCRLGVRWVAVQVEAAIIRAVIALAIALGIACGPAQGSGLKDLLFPENKRVYIPKPAPKPQQMANLHCRGVYGGPDELQLWLETDWVDFRAVLGPCRSLEIFYSFREAQVVIEKWRIHYNTKRPHSALGYRPPARATIAPNPNEASHMQ